LGVFSSVQAYTVIHLNQDLTGRVKIHVPIHAPAVICRPWGALAVSQTLIAISAATVSAGYSQYLFRLAHATLYRMTKANSCVTLSLSSREPMCRQ
jgi:hypothetical protein